MSNSNFYSVLRNSRLKFVVTGAAGFIGSNLVEALLRGGQTVVAVDNYLTGHRHNIEQALQESGVPSGQLDVMEADVRDLEACLTACKGADVVLHQAALGSVPRSIKTPLDTHSNNVDGFVNMLWAAKERGVKRFVFASSSSVYGDSPVLPKVEHTIGRPLSPYALTKAINEQYAHVFARTYGLEFVGLRYFNVFGRRQNPDGPYAAVIPRWIQSLMRGEGVDIFGDGQTSRDFCYIENVLQMNVLAATCEDPAALNRIYNVACGQQTTLNELYRCIEEGLKARNVLEGAHRARYKDFRAGDVRHSLADIDAAKSLLGYEPEFDFASGIEHCLDWYFAQFSHQLKLKGVA